ncbi:class I SAM-dependent methyltransferase [Blastopirellula marina]|uniref:Class I SAM-dependent methyltransferase n=1 Tax=Blastopirellula marina TaxID=124 RepID=A0A2S8FUI3_9BACT|nr:MULTISPECIES: class I SAM-dependent methyltransferase [Pirellulaceae]PQO35841.1 class I SAM-dependent methyltransferase [Blastopirellula marina]RCS53416.1 class I SAM-dependent methyltransferase [Bremerella cremea]
MNPSEKSTVEEIRARFDSDVDRFSNLETGQSATMDAPLVLDLITQVAATHRADAKHVLDIGCGAGNYTLKLLQRIPGMNCTLVDLSQPMLDRARQRVSESSSREITTIQGDIREVDLPGDTYDVVMAAAVLHHLRDDADWKQVFQKIHQAMRPGGIFLVSDLVTSDLPAADQVQWQRYGEYLNDFRDDAYRQTVFDYIEKEDTPRSVLYQVDVCRAVGFRQVEVLHLNACFGAYCAVK